MFSLILLQASILSADEPSGAELDRIGRRIWQSECGGTVEGLTSWNTGENFASLGIGHFIWYPKGVQGPFEESFPKLITWLKAEGVTLPQWLAETGPCPWPDRKSFDVAHNGAQQKDLRALLSRTIRSQVRFIIHRLEEAVPKYRAAAGKQAQRVDQNIFQLRQTAAGNFAMIDYVNFKGEGLNPKERYQGEGWGLLQVLVEMDGDGKATPAERFASAAQRVLTRRVKNSPPERGEKRWLEGWKSRCAGYAG
ncbi:MAG: hypothetical protein K8R87_08695 [Verrucomicrobia bacterium]|nr:hypothetical protein [Verrucomicrobiota bacterium]